MVMGRKQGFGSGSIMNVFDDGLGEGHPIIGRCSPSQLIKQNQGLGRCLANGMIGLHHFHHEGRLTRYQVISSSDSGINRIKDWQLGLLRWYIGANLGKNHNDRQLAHIGRLPAHIWPRNQLNIPFFVHKDAIRNIGLGSHHFLNNRMTTFVDRDSPFFMKEGTIQLLRLSDTG